MGSPRAQDVTLTTFSPPEAADSLDLHASDSLGRRMFVAYTTPIPWMIGRAAPATAEEEACYLFAGRSKR